LRHTPPDGREQRIFDIVNQLNQGWEVSADQAARDELAELNLLAGRKAKASAAYEPAFNHLQVGLELLAADSWDAQYDLTLALHVEAAEAAYLSGEFEQMEQLADTVLVHARALLDKVKVYQVQIQALTIQTKAREALQVAFAVLKSLGVDLPEHPDPSDVARGLQETQAALAGKLIEDLVDLPMMTDPDKLAAMRILSNIMSPSHIAMPDMFPLLVMRLVSLSIQHGNSPISSVGYSLYGLILCGIVGDIEAGYRFGQLALRLLDKLNAREVRAMVTQFVAVFTRHWKEPLRAILPCLPEAYQTGLETGDLAYAGYSAHQVCTHLYFAGLELAEVEQKTATYSAALANIKQETALQWNQVLHQAVLNLRGQADSSAGSPPCRLAGAVYDGQVMLPLHQQTGNRTGIFLHYFHGLMLCYLFEVYSQATENAELAETYLDGVVGLLHVPVFHFYDSLARLAIWPTLTPSEQQSSLEKVVANQEKMKQWAQHAPANYLHKYDLVEAERARVLGHDGEARECYDRAIDLARENEYVNEEALACELAARFYLSRGRPKIAQVYLQEARSAYRRWGALTKVRDLEEARPVDLTTPTLTPQALDWASVMKAAQSISREIVLDKLLARLIEIVIENAGARRGCLVLDREGRWVIEAEGTVERATPTVRQSIPLDAASPPLLPATIVNYVVHTQEHVVLNDAAQEGQFTLDPYIVARRPKSILCMPLLHQSELIGLLYLENDLTTHAFTPERLEVLRLLSGQMTISLENAGLYAALQTQHAQTEAILRSVADAIIMSDPELRIRYVNPAFTALTGYPEEDVLGLPAGSVGAGAGMEQLDQLIRSTLAEGKPWHGETMARRKDGRAYDVALTVAPMCDADGRLIGYVSSHRDVSRLKDLERARSRFITNVSHQLRTPAATIRLYIHLLREGRESGKADDYLQMIEEETAQLVHLIQDILTMTTLDSGQAVAVWEPIRLPTLVGDLAARYLGRAETAGLTLTVKPIPAGLPVVKGDQERLTQALGELVENALTFTPSGGQVTVEVGVQEDAVRTWMTFSVRDTGPGVPLEEQEKIFERFFRGSVAESGHIPGTGLGLSIVQEIVRAHGGRVTVESQAGEGSTFTICLPAGE
jgi:PAS domain S-box-containing protein